MDNRWKFLYLRTTELWGRREKAGARNEETGANGVGVWQENPPCNPKT